MRVAICAIALTPPPSRAALKSARATAYRRARIHHLTRHKMLNNTVKKYLKLFKNFPNYRETDTIADEMKKEFEI